MGRRAAREIAMKLLYQLEFQKDNKEEQINAVLCENVLSDNDKEYITSIVNGVEEYKNDIDRLIEKYSKSWKINRISKVDLSILRLSIFEITHRKDIPLNVSINEAVELAKKYSSEGAGAFVNGILRSVSNERVLKEGE